MLAIFLGLTQALGMAGAAFGTKPVHLVIVGWQEVWIGFMVARELDWPEGASIVLVLAAQFGAAVAYRHLRAACWCGLAERRSLGAARSWVGSGGGLPGPDVGGGPDPLDAGRVHSGAGRTPGGRSLHR